MKTTTYLKFLILPIVLAVVLCVLPFFSAAEIYTHNFTDLQSLYINNVFFIHDKNNTTSDILSISRYLSFGETFNSLQDSDYDNAIISYMEEFNSSVPVPFKVDSIVSLNPIAQDIDESILNGSTDIVLHFECFMLCGSNTVSSPGEITSFTYNNISNFTAIHPATVNDIGDYHGPYRTSRYDSWKNRLWKISFDFVTRTGFSFLATTNYFEDDSIVLYTYSPALSITYENDFGVGDTSDDIAALDENLRQTINEQTAAIISAFSAQTISINNSLSNMEQTIDEGLYDVVDEISDMYSGLSDDMDDIKGYITQTLLMPGTNQSYADYIAGKSQDFEDAYQDMQDYEDAINAYLDRSSVQSVFSLLTSQLLTYKDGFTFWSSVISYLTNQCAPFTLVLIYCSFTLILLSSISGIVFAFRRMNLHQERREAAAESKRRYEERKTGLNEYRAEKLKIMREKKR